MAGVTSFGDSSGDGVVSLGSKSWNIADGFTKIKILRILIEIDLYETIAHFGYKDSEERSRINPEDIPELRVEALERVLFYLMQVMGNCKFAVTDKNDKASFEDLYNRLLNVDDFMDAVANSYYDDLTKKNELVVNEKHFRLCEKILRSIKDDLHTVLNNADLIFRGSDEIDLDKMMEDIVQGG
jgi:hypothetical protein